MSVDVAERFPTLFLTEGGPGDLVMRWLRLSPPTLRARRAAVVLAAVGWLPLLVLCAAGGLLLGGARVPFLYDIAAHVRFLVAVPVLMLAEIPIGVRLRRVTAHFVEAGLVPREQQPRFAELIVETLRFRDARVPELIVLGAAYVMAFGMLTQGSLQSDSTWHTSGPHAGLTAAGYWYALVSLPLFQFLLYRWLYRMLVWTRFLRKVAALDLGLTPTHPDGAGGLGFLGKSCIPFGTLLFALSAVMAAGIADRILFDGASLAQFKFSYAALFVIALLVFVAPLLVFVPKLAALKREAGMEYGRLASRYTQMFERKWIKREGVPEEELLGTADIQSLADLGNSFELVRKMRVLPIEAPDFMAMALPGLVPVVPLLATVMPLSDILKGLLRLLA
jgi:hypothetical protein